MNRFLSKKKVAGLDDGSSVHSGPSIKDGKKRSKRGKKTQEEPKFQLDLATALPTTADLRTSLLMPNLSARFSMLREQDDPYSKLGKASDDSVLQPRRQSRLMDFGYTSPRIGLADIAEVASVNGSTRKPWLRDQHDSFVSDDSFNADGDSTNGSIMSRARPGEGNILFGGRQKIYKISDSASTKMLQSGPSMGKLVYDDDVSQSAFQKFQASERAAREAAARREAEEEAQRLQDYNGFAFGLPQSSASEKLPQTTYSHDTNRSPHPSSYRGGSLDSSAASDTAQEHTSTPATSIGSGPYSSPSNGAFARRSPNGNSLERSMTKRKLYEQSLDQSMQQEQHTQLTRLNSIQRQRQFSGGKSPTPGLTQSKSAQNLNDHFASTGSGDHHPSYDNAIGSHAASPSPQSSHPQSPTFLPLHDYDDSNPLAAAILPGDRGKATAMGAFDVPKQPFDEDQYLQRLQRLQSSQSPTPVYEKSMEQVAMVDSPQLPRYDSSKHENNDDSQSEGDRSSGPQTTAPEPSQPSAFSVFQKAAAQMRSQQPDHSLLEQRSPEPTALDPHRTFFGDISPSDDDDEDPYDFERRSHYNSRYRPGGLENIDEHPSNRYGGFAEIREEEEEDDYVMPVQPLRTKSSKMSLANSTNEGAEDLQQLPSTVYTQPSPPVPRLPQHVDGGHHALGGLVHQHLRNTSNVSSSAASEGSIRDQSKGHFRNNSGHSSFYPATLARDDSVPTINETSSRFSQRTYGSENRTDNKYTHSNPWDLDDADDMPALQGTETRAQLPQESQVGTNRESAGTSWRPDHQRDISEGTLLEREAFANELAARQRAIQENLKSMVVADSRNASPTPTPNGAFKALNMLRPKSSRDSIVKPELAPSKAMKMLGLGGPPSTGGLSRKSSVANDDSRASSDRIPNLPSGQWPVQPPPPPAASSYRNYGLNDQVRSRAESESSMSGRMPPPRPSPPATVISQARNRSESAASGMRGSGRMDRPYDDGERRPSTAAASQNPSSKFSPNFNNNHSSVYSQHMTPQHSPALNVATSGSIRDDRSVHSHERSPYSPNAQKSPVVGWPSLPDRSQPLGITNAPSQTSFNPGPPPPVPSSTTSPGQIAQSPYFANPTPPASGLSTPTPFNPPSPAAPHIPIIKQHGAILRKKTVSKAEIGEPILISSTSNIDTVDLPPGASLKNGMEPPPIPPTNPRRRGTTKKLFGFGKENNESTPESHRNVPSVPNGSRVKSPEPLRERSMEQAYRTAPAHSARPTDIHNGPPSDSATRLAGPASASLQRPIMSNGNMF